MEKFPDEKSAGDHFIPIRWNDPDNPGSLKVICPHCGHRECYTYSDGKRYKCKG